MVPATRLQGAHLLFSVCVCVCVCVCVACRCVQTCRKQGSTSSVIPRNHPHCLVETLGPRASELPVVSACSPTPTPTRALGLQTLPQLAFCVGLGIQLRSSCSRDTLPTKSPFQNILTVIQKGHCGGRFSQVRASSYLQISCCNRPLQVRQC